MLAYRPRVRVSSGGGEVLASTNERETMKEQLLQEALESLYRIASEEIEREKNQTRRHLNAYERSQLNSAIRLLEQVNEKAGA